MKNEKTILEFLEYLRDEYDEDGEGKCKIEVHWSMLCRALEATGKYDESGYKLSEPVKQTA